MLQANAIDTAYQTVGALQVSAGVFEPGDSVELHTDHKSFDALAQAIGLGEARNYFAEVKEEFTQVSKELDIDSALNTLKAESDITVRDLQADDSSYRAAAAYLKEQLGEALALTNEKVKGRALTVPSAVVITPEMLEKAIAEASNDNTKPTPLAQLSGVIYENLVQQSRRKAGLEQQ